MIRISAAPADVERELLARARFHERQALKAKIAPAWIGEEEYARGLGAGWRDCHRYAARELRRLASEIADAEALGEWYGDLGYRAEFGRDEDDEIDEPAA